MELIERLELEH